MARLTKEALLILFFAEVGNMCYENFRYKCYINSGKDSIASVAPTYWHLSQGLGNTAPNFHWTFDIDDNHKTYEVNSATENVGTIDNGTTIRGSASRFGSVAYFSGKNSGIMIKNLTSSCFLSPGLCKNGLSISFWINWLKAIGGAPIVISPGIALKHVDATTIFVELWNGSMEWSLFSRRTPIQDNIWQQYTVTWNKTALKVYINGVREGIQNVPTKNRKMGLIDSKAAAYPNRLAFSRSSSDDAGATLNTMYLDDFKIWETYLNDEQVLNYHNTEIYDPELFVVEDISEAIQFISLSGNYQHVMKVTSMISKHLVSSLEECFRLCTNELSCRSIGFKIHSSSNICMISNDPLVVEPHVLTQDEFHYYVVHRD